MCIRDSPNIKPFLSVCFFAFFKCLPKMSNDKIKAMKNLIATYKDGVVEPSPIFVNTNVPPQMNVTVNNNNSAFQPFKFYSID